MRRLLLENLGWKLLSLALAILLWFVVVGAPEFFQGTLPERVRSALGG
jgi:hypothetical protein